MRNELENILKTATRELALRERADATQEQMAEALFMSTRSYSDIECGVTACGALTLALLLMRLPSADPFLQSLRGQFERGMQKQKGEEDLVR